MKNNIKNHWWILLVIFVLSTNINIYAQRGDITIRLEFALFFESFSYTSCGDVSGQDTVPDALNFPFLIENHTKKKMLFGSNTHNYYRNSESLYYKDSNYGVIGRFLMINGSDTIPLFTDQYNIKPWCSDEIMIWGQIPYSLNDNRTYIFNDLLCRFAHFKNNHKERIYNYLNEARFVYIPIISDYELRMSECENDSIRSTFIYPMTPIEVTKKDPFTVFFIWDEDMENAEMYPKENDSSE